MVFRFIRKIEINFAWNFTILMVAKISLKTTRFLCSDLRWLLVCYSPLNLDSNKTYFVFFPFCFGFNTKLTGLQGKERLQGYFCSLRFYVQNMDVKILISQIFTSVKILLFGGVSDLIKNTTRNCHVWTRRDIKILKLSWQCGSIRRSGSIRSTKCVLAKRNILDIFVCPPQSRS